MTFGTVTSVFRAARFRLADAVSDAAERQRLAALPIVGGISSIPSRSGGLVKVVEHILPQVDRLHLFLHGYDEVPAGLERPGLTIYRGAKDHPYRASGKFYGLSQEPGPCLYFGFDDDILYFDGHVRRLRAGLLRYGGRALVGIHGVRFRDPRAHYTVGRSTRQFSSGLLFDEVVDQIGVGTCAFASDRLPLDPPSWPHGDMDDLMIAIETQRRGMPRIAIARPRRSIVPLHANAPDSIWEATMRDDSRQTVQMATLMRLMRRLPETAGR